MSIAPAASMDAAFVPALPARSQLCAGRGAAVSDGVCARPSVRRRAAVWRRASMCADAADKEESVPLVGRSPDAIKGAGAEAPAEDAAAEAPAAEAVEDEEDDRTEQQKENDRLRAAEKFIRLDEGKFECPGCGYVYEPEKGEFMNGVAAGTAFADLPDSFCCPACKTPGRAFSPIVKTIAGFAENQQYGFGTNTMTAAQKNGLIFGGLGFFFLLLLSGYALN